ncbi:MAG: glycosyltransferase family 39 protein [Chitinophagales bacterium]|nr:glycosyltransferase family 39 protein [Chitinophagales bacterium]
MNKWLSKNSWPYWAMLLLFVGLFGALNVMDFRGEEPRRALVAWEMLQLNNWMRPTIQGWPYYNKPPLFNWILIIFYKLTGSTDNWVVRLPSLLAYVGMVILHYRVAQKWLGKEIALWSSFFMLTSVHHLFFASVLSGELDLLYALIVYAQALAIFVAYQRQHYLRLFILSYLLLSLGFLTKGIPSILFQGATLLGVAIMNKHWKWLFSWQHLLGALLGLIPLVAYFGAYEMRYGEGWLYLFNLLEEATQKSAGENKLLDSLLHIFEFPLQFFADHLPWTLALFLLPFRKMKALVKENALLRFSLLFIIANIWVYWISPGTRQRYLYMFLPFVMVLLAAFFHHRIYKIKPIVVIGLILGLAGARVAYNYTILPYQQRTMKSLQVYRAIHEASLDAAKGGEIRTFGIPDTIYVNPSIGPLTILTDTIYIPQYYPYQIPLALAKEQGAILKYDTLAQVGITYLTTDSLLEESAIEQIFYRKDVWGDKELKVLEFNRSVPPIPKQ